MTTNYNNIPKYSRFNLSENESDIAVFVQEYKERVRMQLLEEEDLFKTQFVSFANNRLSIVDIAWLQDNDERFFRDTANDSLIKQNYLSACGFICCLIYSEDGRYIIVGHSTGLIQMRHGGTGTVLCTLRNIQFPPKPIYALEYSKTEDKVCYAACMDGHVYRIEIPPLAASVDDPPQYCIRVDPALECLHMQFYGSPGIASYATSFISQRAPALSLGLTADQTKMVVGYGDSSMKVYDMETQEVSFSYMDRFYDNSLLSVDMKCENV